ncbi:MAG: tyrosine-type recombinase/integrase [Candidatus Nitrosocosmicus sp.]|nr:tyrosine-type recombinase/integrase [Candidatus Nitrosocosmicus sp.]MDN5867628.1 tyrosine-type recombinase/integrase [Candidatus Nitrosocosmicus sp.]
MACGQLDLANKIKKSSSLTNVEKSFPENLREKINQMTKTLSKPYFNSIFIKLVDTNKINAEILYQYILAEQTELNIKNSTIEGKIKVLIWLSNFHGNKSYKDFTKQDILQYLSSLRKSQDEDRSNKWVGTYNGRQIILQKFFRWLYTPEENYRDSTTPPCMKGVRKLPRREKTPYKPSDIWNLKEHAMFLKYCPNIRDRCYHALARDMSARPHEILGLKIQDIKFNISDTGLQYAEARITNGKTGPRTVPLIDSLPYIKEWIESLDGKNSDTFIFRSFGNNHGSKLSLGGLSSRYVYYKTKYFPSILLKTKVIDKEKLIIKNMLTKPWNPYIYRHSALTEKSLIISESALKDHAGWTMSSKMTQIYVHLQGESSKILLQNKGIITKEDSETLDVLKKLCPNCNNPNKPDSIFCMSCKMVLTLEAYADTIEEKEKREVEIKNLEDKHEKDMVSLKTDLESKFRFLLTKLDYERLNSQT